MVILVFEISSNLSRWFFVGLVTDIVFFNGPLTTSSWTPDRTAALWSSIVLLGDKIKTDNSVQVFINTWKYKKNQAFQVIRVFLQFTNDWSMGEVECFSERNLNRNSWRIMWHSTFFRQEFCWKVFKLLFTNNFLQKQITTEFLKNSDWNLFKFRSEKLTLPIVCLKSWFYILLEIKHCGLESRIRDVCSPKIVPFWTDLIQKNQK